MKFDMKKHCLILTLFLLIPNAYGMKRASGRFFNSFVNSFKTTTSRFIPHYKTSFSSHFSKIFRSTSALSNFCLNSRNYNDGSWGTFLPILVAGTAIYQTSKWGKNVYAEEKEEDKSLEVLGNHIKANFIQVITQQEGMKLFQQYCNQLRREEDVEVFNKEMSAFARIFIDSLADIIALLPTKSVTDFFFKIIPLLEASLFTDYKEAMKKAFETHCAKLVTLCNTKDSYSLYALLKLFIKSDSEHHELLFLNELFKHFNDLDDLYYLCVIQTKEGKQRAIEYCSNHLADVCTKDELLDQLRYWIYCDPSLALPLITEQSIKIIVTTGHGHFLIPHLLRAHPSAKNLVETVKNIVANQKN
jgi:hypothetical protein